MKLVEMLMDVVSITLPNFVFIMLFIAAMFFTILLCIFIFLEGKALL